MITNRTNLLIFYHVIFRLSTHFLNDLRFNDFTRCWQIFGKISSVVLRLDQNWPIFVKFIGKQRRTRRNVSYGYLTFFMCIQFQLATNMWSICSLLIFVPVTSYKMKQVFKINTVATGLYIFSSMDSSFWVHSRQSLYTHLKTRQLLQNCEQIVYLI